MRFSGHKPQGRYNDAMPVTTPNYLALASYQNCMQRLQGAWKAFATIRQDRLRHGEVAEKVAEGIVEDLLTGVLDWTKGDITYQIDYADIVLSRNLQKYLVIEVKKPGTLRLGRQSLAVALAQALRYAHAQHIGQVAVSDGYVFYAADVLPGGLQHRVVVNLADPQPPAALWWVSVHGVYRPMEDSRPAVRSRIRPQSRTNQIRDRLFCCTEPTGFRHAVLHGWAMPTSPVRGNYRI